MKSKKKAPTKAQLDARAKFTKMVKDKAASKKAGMKAPAKRTTAKKLCSSVIKREGVKADGTLKKGYKYAKGGKVVKATPVKKKAIAKKGLKAAKKSHLKKVFGGKTYNWAGRSPFKDFAEKEAKAFREKGYYVRLINEAGTGPRKGRGDWLIYILKK